MKIKKILSLLLAVVLVFSLAACQQGNQDPTGSSDVQDGQKVTYTVTVKSVGGLPMEGLDVYVYGDSELMDLKQFGKTDASGKAQITTTAGDGDVAVLSGVSKGYDVKAFYPLTGAQTVITLTSAPVKDADLASIPADKPLSLGDVMYDFTVTDAGGTTLTLSEVLKEKDMVLLNFWYTTCEWCLKEFPYMERAYQNFKDDVAIIALNPYETNDVVATFQRSNDLSFNMANCPGSWPQAFGVAGYPTSVVVDRYGVICLVESGGIVSETPFNNIFRHFTMENYEQKLCYNGVSDVVVPVTPTFTMPASEEMAAVLNQGDITVTYEPETGRDSEFSWPFILGEKNGVQAAYASNQGIDNSFAILYANVYLKAGQALGFDYLSSCASSSETLYVIVDGEDIYQITGVSETDEWKKCYPWVATEDGEHRVALCYMRGEGDGEGDDTVYVRNFRAVDASLIDTPSYIPRQAAVSDNGFDFTYASVVFNPADGYYHVGSEKGPLLLAMLNGVSQFNEDKSVLQMISDGDIVVDGHNYYDDILPFCSYASNSSLYGYCTVNKELGEYLQIVARVDVAGFTSDENEWLKLCCYYDAYGTGGSQLVDPIAGLATFSAFTATLGKNVPENYFYYDRVIVPRGTFARFVPKTSGVYRITSRTETNSSLEGWIFDSNMEELMVYEMDERIYGDENNVSMVFYMEAGVAYYIDICFWDLYETGTIYYDIEYIAASYDHFRLASPGYFTYDTNATGDAMYYTIAGGVKPVLKNGKYYVDLGNGTAGSLLYADFTGITPIFNMSLSQMINSGGFDFTKTEHDETILQYMSQNGNDPAKTKDWLKEYWGSDYDAYAAEYQVEDVLAGKYHGTGKDLTEQARAYLSKMASGPVERIGCVEVDEALAALLQQLMDKYTFAGVDHSWTKVCYYYDHMGPA